MLLADERRLAGPQRAGEPARPSHSLDLMSCLKGDSHVFVKGVRQQVDAEKEIDVGIGKEEILERASE